MNRGLLWCSLLVLLVTGLGIKSRLHAMSTHAVASAPTTSAPSDH